jgi:hypothetical protein
MSHDPRNMEQEELEQQFDELPQKAEEIVMNQFRQMWYQGLGYPPPLTAEQEERLGRYFELEKEINRRQGQ